MSSVGLSDIPRTTSFRLALLFLGLFGAASLILFGFMYWQTVGYLAGDLDKHLHSEMASRLDAHSSERMRQLEARATLDPDGRRPISLFDAKGHWFAGAPATLPSALPPMDQPFDFTLPRDGQGAPFRGIVHRLARNSWLPRSPARCDGLGRAGGARPRTRWRRYYRGRRTRADRRSHASNRAHRQWRFEQASTERWPRGRRQPTYPGRQPHAG